MTTMASQITSLTVVYSTVYSGADQRKHQSSALLAFVWGIHRDRWIPRTKGQLRGKCFHLMTSSCNLWRNDAHIMSIPDKWTWSLYNIAQPSETHPNPKSRKIALPITYFSGMQWLWNLSQITGVILCHALCKISFLRLDAKIIAQKIDRHLDNTVVELFFFFQVSKRLEKFQPEFRGFETSRDPVVRRPSFEWTEAHGQDLAHFSHRGLFGAKPLSEL